jgi:hypothetical protein
VRASAVKKRRVRIAVFVLLLTLAVGVVISGRMSEEGIGFTDLEIRFLVTDAATDKPISDALIAVHDQNQSPPKILRTDASGSASLTTNRPVYTRTIVYWLTGRREDKPRHVSVPEWLIVVSAKGYQPREPWWLSSEYAGNPAEDRGESFSLLVPVKLEPQTP